jgi:hypothetical protein
MTRMTIIVQSTAIPFRSVKRFRSIYPAVYPLAKLFQNIGALPSSIKKASKIVDIFVLIIWGSSKLPKFTKV